ncbi:hypothetical protein NHX12_021529 [Muraenolepis orangiensis]|uniref:Uncharacterized protein n=1 Tax=Muraenolepis orangiensis TaxID=630683 RepID=A0A9Q0IUG4_9TELE|nr:hypothetical protein NHX12_021529 [Muraenolepis orangiensis]
MGMGTLPTPICSGFRSPEEVFSMGERGGVHTSGGDYTTLITTPPWTKPGHTNQGDQRPNLDTPTQDIRGQPWTQQPRRSEANHGHTNPGDQRPTLDTPTQEIRGQPWTHQPRRSEANPGHTNPGDQRPTLESPTQEIRGQPWTHQPRRSEANPGHTNPGDQRPTLDTPTQQTKPEDGHSLETPGLSSKILWSTILWSNVKKTKSPF